jgi:Bacterial SH3 domain
MLRCALIIGVLVTGTAALAEPAPLKGPAIREMVPGAVIHIDTPLGSKLPVRFTDDGLMSGEAGSLASYLGSDKDRGRWWVENDKLCQKWFKWFDAEVKCLELRQEGQRIFWSSDDGKSGTATIAMRTAPAAVPSFAPAYAMSLHAPRAATMETSAEPVEPPVAATKPQPAKPVVVTPPPAKPMVLNQAPVEKPAAAVPDTAPKKEKERPVAAARPQQPSAFVPSAGAPAKPFGQSKSVAPAPAPAPVAGPVASPVVAQVFKVAGVEEDDVLNIRKGPSADHPQIGAIPADGQGVRIAGSCQSEWCPIVYRGVSGWVNRLFLVEEAKLQGSAWLGGNPGRERRLPN